MQPKHKHGSTKQQVRQHTEMAELEEVVVSPGGLGREASPQKLNNHETERPAAKK